MCDDGFIRYFIVDGDIGEEEEGEGGENETHKHQPTPETSNVLL